MKKKEDDDNMAGEWIRDPREPLGWYFHDIRTASNDGFSDAMYVMPEYVCREYKGQRLRQTKMMIWGFAPRIPTADDDHAILVVSNTGNERRMRGMDNGLQFLWRPMTEATTTKRDDERERLQPYNFTHNYHHPRRRQQNKTEEKSCNSRWSKRSQSYSLLWSTPGEEKKFWIRK